MFIGRYYHHLEDKGRVSLPKVFRNLAKEWVITRGLDGGLFVFKEEDFKKKIEELSNRTFTKKNNRDFVRLMVNDAKSLSADTNGRVTLPDYLIEFAKLTKEIVVVGSYTHLELWDVQTYHRYLDTIEPQAEQIAESLENAPSSLT